MDAEQAESGGQRVISVPPDMVGELAVLNDLSQSDSEMMFHIRQFVATFAKKIKDAAKDSKETRIKVEAVHRKTETQDGKISSTR